MQHVVELEKAGAVYSARVDASAHPLGKATLEYELLPPHAGVWTPNIWHRLDVSCIQTYGDVEISMYHEQTPGVMLIASNHKIELSKSVLSHKRDLPIDFRIVAVPAQSVLHEHAITINRVWIKWDDTPVEGFPYKVMYHDSVISNRDHTIQVLPCDMVMFTFTDIVNDTVLSLKPSSVTLDPTETGLHRNLVDANSKDEMSQVLYLSNGPDTCLEENEYEISVVHCTVCRVEYVNLKRFDLHRLYNKVNKPSCVLV